MYSKYDLQKPVQWANIKSKPKYRRQDETPCKIQYLVGVFKVLMVQIYTF
jgi:hypothetical protein